MKKVLFLLLLFVSCSIVIFYKLNKEKSTTVVKSEEIVASTEIRGVFVSYIDYSHLLKGKSVVEQKENIKGIINNLKEKSFNLIILQVRPFSDAIYKSDFYLSSKTVVEKEGDALELDILDYFIEMAHQNNIKIHAWVNPYRIRNTNDQTDINTNNFYYKWFNTNKIEISEAGIYFNPADKEVRDYIINGIKEIVTNYKIDGLLYDDYFYPTKTIDLKNYEEYKDTLTIEEYRIANINTLIYETYKAIKSINKNILFGISPAGNIDNNLNEEYLDIKNILQQENFIDYIMPQMYYGFENENMPFINTLNTWNNLIKNKKIGLYVALSLYKAGEIDNYAGIGKEEWINNNDIIKKQIIISRSLNNYQGFSIYRYDYLNSNANSTLTQEVSNFRSICK